MSVENPNKRTSENIKRTPREVNEFWVSIISDSGIDKKIEAELLKAADGIGFPENYINVIKRKVMEYKDSVRMGFEKADLEQIKTLNNLLSTLEEDLENYQREKSSTK